MGISSRPATEGRIVHVRTPGINHCQPAIVVRAWGDGTGSLNLYLFPDGSNDPSWGPTDAPSPRVEWATSTPYEEPPAAGEPWPLISSRSWHWPEQV